MFPLTPMDSFETLAATPYYSYSQYLKNTFGKKTYKIVVGSGLTCPTRDGTLAKRGCAFCDVRGSSSFYGKKGRGNEITAQIESRIEPIRKRFGAEAFLAYFQSYTNTYGERAYLDGIYQEALLHPLISGLCVGTRPDCLPDDVIELLETTAQKSYVSLELGVQSFEDETLVWLDRGHDRQCSLDALAKLRVQAPHVHTCVHLMFGQPTDTLHAARDAALLLNDSGVKGVKLHQLMVLDHTILAERYREKPFSTVSLERYCEIAREFITHLDSKIYIERLYATASHPEECLAPEWSRDRWNPHNVLRDALKDCVQGSAIEPKKGTEL